MSDFFKYILYSRNRNPIFGELPKYIVQYFVTAWDNISSTFSKGFEVMSNN